MKREKTIRKIAYIVMAMMLVISTVFTGVGTMGVTEAKAAEEPAGRGTDWDYLYSEIRANGNGKAYPVGKRIYMDILAGMSAGDKKFCFDTLEAAVGYNYISVDGEVDEDIAEDGYNRFSFNIGDIITLEENYNSTRGNIEIKSGGYWIFNLDDGNNGDEFYGAVASSTKEGYTDIKVDESKLDVVGGGSSGGNSGQQITES